MHKKKKSEIFDKMLENTSCFCCNHACRRQLHYMCLPHTHTHKINKWIYMVSVFQNSPSAFLKYTTDFQIKPTLSIERSLVNGCNVMYRLLVHYILNEIRSINQACRDGMMYLVFV